MSTLVSTMFTCSLGDDAALVLRTPEIAEAYHELIASNQERLARWEPWAVGPQTLERTRTFLEAAARNWLDGSQLPVAIALQADEGWRLVGSTGLRIDQFNKSAEIGYWIDEANEGRGLATRAVSVILDQAFVTLGLRRVSLHTEVANKRSRALATRLGFTEEGTLRSAIAFAEDRRDEVVYGLLADDWRTDPR